jgi:PAS domain S-box-containing protein
MLYCKNNYLTISQIISVAGLMPELTTIPNEALTLLQAMPGNYMVLLPDSPKFTIVAVTDDFLEATVSRRSEIVGRGIFEVFSDNAASRGTQFITRLRSSLEHVLEHKAPHELPKQQYGLMDVVHQPLSDVNVLNKPVLNAGGGIQYIIHAIVHELPVGEEKNKQQALPQSTKQLQLIIESAKGFAIFTTTAEGVINSWNTGAAGIFGWRHEEIIGQPGDILFLPEERATNQPQIERDTAVANGIAPDIRWHLRKDGSPVFINGFAHPLYDGARGLIGFVKVGRDMTSQHTAEIALRKSEEKYRSMLEKEVEQRTAELNEMNTNLRYANENLQQFASIASHDLQEPLRKLKLFASVLRRFKEHLPEDGQEILHKISVTSERMSQLIREVLQYSRIAHGIREFTRTDLNAILQNILRDLDLLIRETNATIEQKQLLPEIDAIPPQMNQLFYNLLTNALKYRQKERPLLITISFSSLSPAQVKHYPELKANKPYIEIVVADNGIGFDEQYAEQIFQIFERLHSADEYDGTGLGLALCKKIAENHSGHIFARSREGEGAFFHVLLPVHQ